MKPSRERELRERLSIARAEHRLIRVEYPDTQHFWECISPEIAETRAADLRAQGLNANVVTTD